MEKEIKKTNYRPMIVFEKNQLANFVEYNEARFNAVTGNAKPSIEVRFTQPQFGEYICRMNEQIRNGMVGALLIKAVGQELYLQPCGNDLFIQTARSIANKLGLVILE